MSSPVFDPIENEGRNLAWVTEAAGGEEIKATLNRILLTVMQTGSDVYIQRRGTAPYLIFLGAERQEEELKEEEVLGLIARLKVMAGLDVSETHKRQVGTIELNIEQTPINVNVTFEPMLLGEEVSLEMIRQPQREG